MMQAGHLWVFWGECRQSGGRRRSVLWVTSKKPQLQPSPGAQRVHSSKGGKWWFRSRKGGFGDRGALHLFGQALVADFAPFAALLREVLDAWNAVRPEALGRRAERQAALR